MMQSFKRFLNFLALFGFTCLGVLFGHVMSHKLVSFQLATASSGLQSSQFEDLELFGRVLHYVKNFYVEDVDSKTLIHGAIKGMLESLDPHSSFLSGETFKDMQIDTSGKFGGLGLELTMMDGVLTIRQPIEDTPAWKVGLRALDRIIEINDESTKGMGLLEAVAKMRGAPKSSVKLTIFRQAPQPIRHVTIIREMIKIASVKVEVLDGGYHYARLTTFNESAGADLKKAIEQMKKTAPIAGLVLDLRMNPGGLLDQAVEVASLFLKEGIVVSSIGRDKDKKDIKMVRPGLAFEPFPMAVLVDSSTASAAEIVAGALQDHDRAIILGQPTFGKGSVQTVTELSPDMAIKLTVARFYTPSGRGIQEMGVEPNILLDRYDPKLLTQAKVSFEPFREQDLRGHMAGVDAVKKQAKKDQDGSKSKNDKKDKKEKFSVMDLKSLGQKKNGKDASDEDNDMLPYQFKPKEDYQVLQALNVLKGNKVLQEMRDRKPKL